MNDLDRIEHALATTSLDHRTFERCAQDLLVDIYPALTPILGGTDWGRDADIGNGPDRQPTRVLITAARTVKGITDNMRRGVKSMRAHEVAVDRVVLANPASLSLLDRHKIISSAQRLGVQLDASEIFEAGFFASRLRRDGHWRRTLLGLPATPISISRRPSDLAESPWAFLPLTGRDEDIAAISAGGDTIVTGPPGVGKSRTVAAVDGVVFVDKDAEFDQIAEGLRWTNPGAVVIDDAGGSDRLLRRLKTLRSSEPEVFRYRIMAICWPDQVADLATTLPDANVYSLPLLERADLDQVIKAMGVTGQFARAEILRQAEGRPGWAVALANLLLRSRDTESLVSGRALVGHVDRYMRRAGLKMETIDLLAVTAALGGIRDTEVQRLGSEVDLSRRAAADAITSAANGGLIDTMQGRPRPHGASGHRWLVRPPMLARALVAERVFTEAIALVDFDGLADRWPDRLGELAAAAIGAAHLGAPRARQPAEALTIRALMSPDVGLVVKSDLRSDFARIDRAAADLVVRQVREEFDAAIAMSDIDPASLESIVSVSALTAAWYRSTDAIQLLLEACLLDGRPTNSNPGHPLRKIEDIVRQFHPEVERDSTLRFVFAKETLRFFAADPAEPQRQAASAKVTAALMSLKLSAAHNDPVNPMSFQLAEGVLGPDEIDRTLTEIWPNIAAMLDAGSDDAAHAAVTTAIEWLHIGSGHDRPFGVEHPAHSIAAALRAGTDLVGRLAARTDLSVGAAIRLRDSAQRHGINVADRTPARYEPFFRDIAARGDERLETVNTLVADLEAVGTEWATGDPTSTVNELLRVRRDLERTDLRWPDRVGVAAGAIAKATRDPLEWLDACLAAGLVADGCHFAALAMTTGTLAPERLKELLADDRSHRLIIDTILADSAAPAWSADLAIDAIGVSDYRVLEVLMARDQVTDDHLDRLLNSTSDPIRAMAAVAYFASALAENWEPGRWEKPWIAAIGCISSDVLNALPSYELGRLGTYLASKSPDTLVAITVQALTDEDSNVFQAPHDLGDSLHLLPARHKAHLWSQFKNEPRCRWYLNRHLAGGDTVWIASLLDSEEMTTDDAIDACSGFDRHPPIEDVAILLVPKGVEPERIAALKLSGSWWGDRSTHYSSIAKTFESMADHDDTNVQAVAAAGIRMFTAMRDEALAEERIQRVRGLR